MKHKGDFLDRFKYLIAGFLIGVLVFTFYYTDQMGIQESLKAQAAQAAKTKNYEIVDKCGLFPGSATVSHSIPNEEMCQNTCRARCESESFEYKNAVFTAQATQCNKCDCICA